MELAAPAEPAEPEGSKAPKLSAGMSEIMKNMKELTRLAEIIGSIRPTEPSSSSRSSSVSAEGSTASKNDHDDPDVESNTTGRKTWIDIEIFRPRGDVILVVGLPSTCFRVHSQCLKSASPAFCNMLGNHNMSFERPQEIQLKQEVAAVFRIIVCVIHHVNNRVPLALPPDLLLATAMTAAKYRLQNTFRFVMKQWLRDSSLIQQTAGMNPAVAVACFMSAAALFDDEEMFVRYNRTLITGSYEPYVQLLAFPPLRRLFPERSIKLLTHLRDRLRARINQILVYETGLACYCRWGEDRQRRYENFLLQYKPDKVNSYAVAHVVPSMKKALHECLGRRPGDDQGSTYDLSACLRSITEELDNAVKRAGVSLDWYRRVVGGREADGVSAQG